MLQLTQWSLLVFSAEPAAPPPIKASTLARLLGSVMKRGKSDLISASVRLKTPSNWSQNYSSSGWAVWWLNSIASRPIVLRTFMVA